MEARLRRQNVLARARTCYIGLPFEAHRGLLRISQVLSKPRPEANHIGTSTSPSCLPDYHEYFMIVLQTASQREMLIHVGPRTAKRIGFLQAREVTREMRPKSQALLLFVAGRAHIYMTGPGVNKYYCWSPIPWLG